MAKYVLTENERLIVDGVEILEYYNTYVVPTDKKYTKMVDGRTSGICPLHDDTDPSFKYFEKTKTYYCFGCGEAGNIISLHSKFAARQGRNIGYKNALIELANMYGITLLLDEKGEIKEESVFDIARKRNELSQYERNTYDREHITVAGFRRFNEQVKRNIDRNPYATGEFACSMYYSLDLALSKTLAEAKNG